MLQRARGTTPEKEPTGSFNRRSQEPSEGADYPAPAWGPASWLAGAGGQPAKTLFERLWQPWGEERKDNGLRGAALEENGLLEWVRWEQICSGREGSSEVERKAEGLWGTEQGPRERGENQEENFFKKPTNQNSP